MNDHLTQYLYGNLSQPFQITASRNLDNVLTVYYYDDYGALYALERGGVRYYVGSDHLGTPKVVTDNTGAIVRQVEYDSWGVKISDTNPGFDLPVGFAGGIPDDATGLVRFGFRDYEPGTGRWAAKDPIFFEGGQLNLFVYAGNDPVNIIDPSGLSRRSVALGTLSYALNTGALIATPAPVVAVPLKVAGVVASVASILNAAYETGTGEISWTQFGIISGVEVANMLGNVPGAAGALIGTLGRGADIAITTKDAANLICH